MKIEKSFDVLGYEKLLELFNHNITWLSDQASYVTNEYISKYIDEKYIQDKNDKLNKKTLKILKERLKSGESILSKVSEIFELQYKKETKTIDTYVTLLDERKSIKFDNTKYIIDTIDIEKFEVQDFFNRYEKMLKWIKNEIATSKSEDSKRVLYGMYDLFVMNLLYTDAIGQKEYGDLIVFNPNFLEDIN